MIYFCCDQNRRDAVSNHKDLRGIDFVEVSSDQSQVFVHFVPAPKGVEKQAVPEKIEAANVSISSGDRVTGVRVTAVAYNDSILVVTVDDDGKPGNGVGDFSTYTLRLAGIPNLDPLLSGVEFSFKAGCHTEFDCKPQCICPPEQRREPELDYLAKDFTSFRRLMLDRITALVPQWTERHAADLGVTLVELLAYVADYLSYQQDAVATEAYLGTARRRVSVRRHARLIDYFVHDGCNARVWVAIQVGPGGDGLVLPRPRDGRPGTTLLTLVDLPPGPLPPEKEPEAMEAGAVVFETMHDLTLWEAHNKMWFYTWGDRRCCLPKGATRATLRGCFPELKPGTVLVFEEVLGPATGQEEDADPKRRHAVRLRAVNCGYFELTEEALKKFPRADAASVIEKLLPLKGRPFTTEDDFLKEVQAKTGKTLSDKQKAILLKCARQTLMDPLAGEAGEAITEIEWHDGDALPFPFCISSVTDVGHGQKPVANVSVARGNIVLADHGRTIPEPEKLETFPRLDSKRVRVAAQPPCRCDDLEHEVERERLQVWPRYRPQLKARPLTQTPKITKTVNGKSQRVAFDPDTAAASAFKFDPKDVMPAISLADGVWQPRRDLLSNDGFAKEFVVETETDGTAFLRFGDGRHGMRPKTDQDLTAVYRIGNGAAGNVGAETIAHIVTGDSRIVAVRNPLPATGGHEPETLEHVRRSAPYAFRTQERAVTEEDYEEVTQRLGDIQRAAATFRWTGSWHTVFLTADRRGGLGMNDDFKTQVRDRVERYRMAGYDLEVEKPAYVSLEIQMHVCVSHDYFRSDVKKALLEIFSNRDLPDGRRGVFHPDNFTFGQTVYLSQLYAAAQAVAGVTSVQITTFKRQDGPASDTSALKAGKLGLGRTEIARLDNDPNFPEHGVFTVIPGGGK